jgi:phage protein U
MLCLIGDFQFTVDGTSYDSFTSNITYPFATNERIGDYDSYQSVGKEEQKDSIAGVLIAKSMRALDDFEKMAAKKEAVTIAFSTGAAYSVLIFSISKTKNLFLKDGAYVKQSYSIELVKVGT